MTESCSARTTLMNVEPAMKYTNFQSFTFLAAQVTKEHKCSQYQTLSKRLQLNSEAQVDPVYIQHTALAAKFVHLTPASTRKKVPP